MYSGDVWTLSYYYTRMIAFRSIYDYKQYLYTKLVPFSGGLVVRLTTCHYVFPFTST
jgi:hypothetical protein